MSLSNPPRTIGRHELLRPLGAGGMGTLYLATDPLLSRLVAIKVLRDEIDSPQLRERFKREAKSAGSLKHRNIVTILDVGEDGGKPFIVMEYIEGETLTAIIRRGDQMTLDRKLQLMIELCEGLHCAHSANPRIVHRDISPSNIMVDNFGVLKILDFGVAKVGTSEFTVDSSVVGKLSYMAPEQLLNQSIDVRADMFSAGVVFYELLAYRRAFPGDNFSVIHNVIEGTPEPLEQIIPGLDPQLMAVVNRCLAKKPDGRYDTMDRVRRELAAVRSRLESDTGGRKTGRAWRPELEQIRQQQIESELEAAYAALEAGDHERALHHSRKLLLLDDASQPAQEIEARALKRIRDAQIQRWLTDARSNLDAGQLTAASLLVDQALSLSSASPEALAIRQLVDAKRREIAEARERAARLEKLIAAAEQQLDEGALELALQSISEAVALDAAHAGATALHARIVAAVEEEQRQKADRAARSVIDEARRLFADGQYVSAFQLLQRDSSGHPSIAPAFDALRAEAAEIQRRSDERRRRDEEERRRRDEDRQRREEEERHRQLAEQRRLEAEAKRARERLQREQEAEARRRESELRRRPAESAPADDDRTKAHPVMDEAEAAEAVALASERPRGRFLQTNTSEHAGQRVPRSQAALKLGGILAASILVFFITRYLTRPDATPQPASSTVETPAAASTPATSPATTPSSPPENSTAVTPAPATSTAAPAVDNTAGDKRPSQSAQPAATTPTAAKTSAAATPGDRGGRSQPPQATTTTIAAEPPDPVLGDYNRAKELLAAGRSADAIALIRAIQAQRPNYRDTAQMLAESERGQARAAGRQAMDQGARLEASGNLRGAVEQYDRASQLDPSSKDSADAASKRVRGAMKTASADAIKRGDLYYALDRIADAIRFYEQALNNMLNDDPARRTLEARLAELRARK